MGMRKAIGIRELKNNLSAYLREVRGGTCILVLDRNRVVGELIQPSDHVTPLRTLSNLGEWTEKGYLHLPKSKRQKCPPSPLKSPSGLSLKLL